MAKLVGTIVLGPHKGQWLEAAHKHVDLIETPPPEITASACLISDGPADSVEMKRVTYQHMIIHGMNENFGVWHPLGKNPDDVLQELIASYASQYRKGA